MVIPAQSIKASGNPSGQAQTSSRLLPGIHAIKSHWLVLLGATALVVPTVVSLAAVSWATEDGAHGPVVIATGVWLILRNTYSAEPLKLERPFVPVVLLAISLLGYGIGRITGLITIEAISLYFILLSGATLLFGTHWIRRSWFPLVYLLFAIPLPDNIMISATQPLKLAISATAVKLLSFFGYTVGRAGVTLQVDQYQLLVATACTGVNSMTGIIAISIFYVYLRYAQNWRLALLLVMAIIPIGILLNFMRVVALILQTHYFGDASAQGYTHKLSGFLMFGLALGMLFTIEEPMSLLARKFGWREHAPTPALPKANANHTFMQTPATRRELVVGASMAIGAIAVWRDMPRRRIGLAEGVAIEHLIPKDLNGWTASPSGDFVLPEADEALQASIYQDVLMRSYGRDGTVIMLLIAYSRAQTHMLHIHRPEKCYPAAGFTVSPSTTASLTFNNGQAIKCAFISAKSLERTEQVIYWLRIGDCFPVSFIEQHLSIASQNISGYVPDGAIVRLSTISEDADGARVDLIDFAKALVVNLGMNGRTLLLGPAIADRVQSAAGHWRANAPADRPRRLA